jgi:hypothetical protein
MTDQVPKFVEDVIDKITRTVVSSIDRLVIEMLCDVFAIPKDLGVNEIMQRVNEIGGVSYASEFRAVDGILFVDLFQDGHKVGQRSIKVKVEL